MPKNAERTIVLSKVETTEGTDAAPVVTTDALLTRNFSPTFLDAEQRIRNFDYGFLGARPAALTRHQRRFQFETEIAGSGTAGTAAAWQTLLRGCGFGQPTLVASTSATSAPASANLASVTQFAFYENLLMRLIGGRGNGVLNFEDDEVPFIAWDFLGRPASPSNLAEETTPGAPTLTAWRDPVLVSTENTTFLLGAFAAPLRRASINLGNSLEFRSLVGPQDRTLLRQREMTAEFLIELPDLTARNYFTNVAARSTVALSLIHGVTAGNIVEVSAARCELGSPSFSNEQGVLMASFPARILPSAAGNDEISIVAR